MNSKQLVFPHIMTATKIWPDGESRRVSIGQFEAIMIVKENGHEVGGTITLTPPNILVTDVECVDGTIYKFDEPFYCINKSGRGENTT